MNNQNNFINNLFNNFRFKIYYASNPVNIYQDARLIRLDRCPYRIGLYDEKLDEYVSMYRMVSQFPESRSCILEVFILYIYKIISYRKPYSNNFYRFINQIRHIIEVVYNDVNSMLYRIVNVGSKAALYNLMLDYLFDQHEIEVSNHTYTFNTDWFVYNNHQDPVQIVNILIELMCYEFYYEEWYGDFNEDHDIEQVSGNIISEDEPEMESSGEY